MTDEAAIRQEICEIVKRIYNRGMAAANDGNISVKLIDHEILCTPTEVFKGFMTLDILCKVSETGELLEARPGFRPSSELRMHLWVYQRCPNVNSVVRAHPVYATAYAVASKALTQPITAEAVISLGYVPLARYARPSTDEVPDSIEEFLPNFDAVLLANHGALTYSDSLLAAYHEMETVEFYARRLYLSTQLGGPQELTQAQVQDLYALRRKQGLWGTHPANLPLPPDAPEPGECPHTDKKCSPVSRGTFFLFTQLIRCILPPIR